MRTQWETTAKKAAGAAMGFFERNLTDWVFGGSVVTLFVKQGGETREVISTVGDHWWFEIGTLDLNTTLVAIQRGDALIVASTPRMTGA